MTNKFIKIENFKQLQEMVTLKEGIKKSYILVATISPRIHEKEPVPDTFYFAEIEVADLTPISIKLNELAHEHSKKGVGLQWTKKQ